MSTVAPHEYMTSAQVAAMQVEAAASDSPMAAHVLALAAELAFIHANHFLYCKPCRGSGSTTSTSEGARCPFCPRAGIVNWENGE